jgi:hypothetical protein
VNEDPDEHVLFIDESGTASPKDTASPYYILSGCAVKERDRAKIKAWADHIKFKYWGNTKVVFHSKEMSRKEKSLKHPANDFTIFRDETVHQNFLADLEAFLTKFEFYMFYVLVDKKKITALSIPEPWNDIKIYRETADAIIKNFLCFLMSQHARGKIVIEAATTEKDFYFHKALGNYLGNGVSGTGITDKQVKQVLTSISFVTKDNEDTEEQIADLLAYAAKCRYAGAKPGPYETMLLKVVKKKMATEAHIKKANTIVRPRYIKHMCEFEVLPKVRTAVKDSPKSAAAKAQQAEKSTEKTKNSG